MIKSRDLPQKNETYSHWWMTTDLIAQALLQKALQFRKDLGTMNQVHPCCREGYLGDHSLRSIPHANSTRWTFGIWCLILSMRYNSLTIMGFKPFRPGYSSRTPVNREIDWSRDSFHLFTWLEMLNLQTNIWTLRASWISMSVLCLYYSQCERYESILKIEKRSQNDLRSRCLETWFHLDKFRFPDCRVKW
jgi:hypothetical protein